MINSLIELNLDISGLDLTENTYDKVKILPLILNLALLKMAK